MVVIRRGQRNFRERETLGWAKYCYANELVGFLSHKKSKVIHEGMKTRECQHVQGISGSANTFYKVPRNVRHVKTC